MINNFVGRMKPFFDADDGGASGSGEPEERHEANGKETNDKAKTLKEMLSENPALQAEIDRRVNQGVETAVRNERARQQAIHDEMLDEVQRVSNMTAEEKDRYFKEKEAEKNRKREAELTKRELTLDARAELQNKGLPSEFIDLLNYEDHDSCMTSIGTLEIAFRDAVQKAVDAKLAGGTPPKDSKSEGKKTSPTEEIDRVLAEARKLAGIK